MDPTVRVCLLGTVDVRVDEVAVPVGGPRSQALLAVLASCAGEVVTTDRLIDDLWGSRPPPSARASVQAYLSRLRAARPPSTEQLLPRTPHGYLLDPAVAVIDLVDYERFSLRARAALGEHGWAEADRLLADAARLWHGDPFTGLDEVSTLVAHRRRLVDLRRENVLGQLRTELELRGSGGVLVPLRDLVAADPWDERAWRLLVVALYRAGRQTAALEAVHEARRMLAREHGLEPTPALTGLTEQILNHDPALQPSRAEGTAATVAAAAPVPPVPTVGRHDEFARMREAWQRTCRTGRGGLVLVEGEAGVGKTHLAAELARLAESGGARVLRGHCLSEPRLPLQPWQDLLPDGADPTDPPDRAAPHGGGAVVDVWELAAYELFTGVTRRLLDACSDGPALVVVEDLQWAGVAALRLLDHALTGSAGRPLLVVATLRSGGPADPPARAALHDLLRHAQPERVALTGLSVSDTGALLAANGLAVTEPDLAALHARTDGVPMLSLAAVRGGDVIAGQLAGLRDDAIVLAEMLALVGDRTPITVLAAASGLPDDPIAVALDELGEAGLVTAMPGPVLRYRFVHALLRDAVLERLSPARTLALARRLLAATDTVAVAVGPATVARLALHVAATATPPSIERAAGECLRAADAATSVHEHQQAVEWLHRGLDVATEPTRRRSELQVELAVTSVRAGSPHIRALLRTASTDLEDPVLLARLGVGCSRGFFSRGGRADDVLVGVLRAALRSPDALPSGLRARTLAALAAELTWHPDGDERFALADTALALARAAGDPATIAEVLQTRHLTLAAADTGDVSRRDMAELLSLVDGLDDMGLRFAAVYHSTGPAVNDGDPDRTEALLGVAERIADTLRRPVLQWYVAFSRASLLLWRGRLADAEKLAAEAVELGTAAGHAEEAGAYLAMQLLEIRRLQGRLAELAPLLAAVPADVPHSLTVARYAWSAGLRDVAVTRLRRAVPDPARPVLRRDMLERPHLDALAFLAAATGDRVLAAAVRTRLLPLADTVARAVVAHPVGHHWLGLVSDGEAAITHLQQAVARHAEIGAPLSEAESRIELGVALRRRGSAVAARRERERARVIAADLGADGVVSAATAAEERNDG